MKIEKISFFFDTFMFFSLIHGRSLFYVLTLCLFFLTNYFLNGTHT